MIELLRLLYRKCYFPEIECLLLENELEHIIAQCRKEDQKAQKKLFDLYSPMLFALCLRYCKSKEDAEDILVEAFYKILTRIHSYKGEGSFEGWMKRITVNEALMSLRKKNVLNLSVELSIIPEPSYQDEILSGLYYDELITFLDQLPPGYRTVFNLFAIEGYKHREIAKMLNISINTSKSQLILAKKKLAEIIKKKGLKILDERKLPKYQQP